MGSVYSVKEVFYSLQGEGARSGRPAVFCRFSGCNAWSGRGLDKADSACPFCDTDFVGVDGQNGGKYELDNLVNLLISLWPQDNNCKSKPYVVFTGGEPLLYANDPILVSFLEYLHQNGHRITFETNATLSVDCESFPVFKECIYALSVKLTNSAESYKKRVNPDVIHSLATNSKEAFFKFSIDADSIDLALDEEIEEIISHAPDLEVYCMPVGGSKEEVEKNTEPLIEFCKAKGYSFSDRLHIRIWDQNKGV